MADEVELTAKLKLDTSEAKQQLGDVAKEASKTGKKVGDIKLPKDTTKSLKEIFTGKDGIKNVANVARGAIGGFKGLGGAITGVTAQAGKLGGVIALVIALVSTLVKIMTGTDTWQKVQSYIERLVVIFEKALAPDIALIGETLMDLIDIFEDLLVPVLQVATELFTLVYAPLANVLKILKPVIALIGEYLQLISNTFSILNDIGVGVMQEILDTVAALVTVALKPMVKRIEKAADVIEAFGNKVLDFISSITGIRFNRTLASTTGMQVGTTKTSLDKWEATSGETPEEKSARLAAEAAYNAEQAAKYSESSSGVLLDTANGLPGLFDILGKRIEYAWNGITNAAESAWGLIEGTALGVWSWIEDKASGVWDKIEGIADSVWQGVKTAWESIANIFKDAWESVSKFFTRAWSGVKDAASGAWDWVKGLFHANGGTIGATEQIWGMNESGNPEFLFSAGGRNTVVNADILADAVAQGMIRAGGVGQGGKLEVSVKSGAPAGPRELAQWLLPSLKFLLGK